MKIKIGDCNENDAFLTNEDGFDVACLSRYTPTSNGVGSDEHIPHLLADEQWQELINRIDAHDELVNLLFRASDVIGDLRGPDDPTTPIERDIENAIAKLKGETK